MSSIIAPPLPSAPFYIGKGLRDSRGDTLMLFGYPLPNYLSEEFPKYLSPWTIVGETTDFDVSTLTENHEVPFVMYRIPHKVESGYDVYFKWYREHDMMQIFSTSMSIPDPGDDYYYVEGSSGGCVIGWLSKEVAEWTGYEEIRENGYYYVQVIITGGANYSGNIRFVVRGIPPKVEVTDQTMNSFSWRVFLSDCFNTDNYIKAGICTQPFNNGQSSMPSGVLDYNTAPYSNIACVTKGVAHGLSAGTSYTIYGFAQAANGLYYNCGVDYITTLPGSIPAIPSPPYIDVNYGNNGRSEGGVFLRWNPSSDANKYRVNIRRGYDNYLLYIETAANLVEIKPLDYGTTYFFSLAAGNNNLWSEFSSESQGTTAPQTPIISATNVTNNSVRISLGSMSGDWTRVEVYRYSASGALLGTATITKPGQQYVDYVNLSPGTTYKFKARAFLVIGSTTIQSVYESNEVSIITTSARPANWVWLNNELNAFINNGEVDAVTFSRWNEFVDRVQLFINYYNAKTGSSISSVSGAKMTASDKVLSASRFNIVRFAIGSMYPTGITNKSRGETVYGSYFTTLSSSLNNIS